MTCARPTNTTTVGEETTTAQMSSFQQHHNGAVQQRMHTPCVTGDLMQAQRQYLAGAACRPGLRGQQAQVLIANERHTTKQAQQP